MTFFEKIIQKIFPQKKAADVHEVLKRSERDQQAYAVWKNSDAPEQLIRDIAQAYYYKKTNIDSKIAVHLLTTAYANGFAISYPASIDPKSFQHLFDYLQERVQTLGYRVVNADRRIKDRDTYVETTEQYYLKPPVHTGDIKHGSINQLYGNVAVEHTLIDHRPSYIKVQASVYSDRLYQDALHFDEFAERLFEINPTESQ